MHLINVRTMCMEEFHINPPPYGILSHTWDQAGDEVTFQDFPEMARQPRNKWPAKIDGLCRQAETDGLSYVWIDSCCINKQSVTKNENSDAINSMFNWYGRAKICYVYLSDVPSGDDPRNPRSRFYASRWFTRGWTLQELIAPENLFFYDQKWEPLGSKRSLAESVQVITGVSIPFFLHVASLHEASVAQRMSWLASRSTKYKEDLAYCMLGIFQITIPIVYGGDSDEAFFQLQEAILKQTGDDSILAWGLQGSAKDVLQSGALATSAVGFSRSGGIVPIPNPSMSFNPMEIINGRLRLHMPFQTTPDGSLYGLLNCGPESNSDLVVGIPLTKTGAESVGGYAREIGRHALLFKKTDALPNLVRIQSRPAPVTTNRQNWFLVPNSTQADLDLVEVHPRASWLENKAAIMTPDTEDGGELHTYLARFRFRKNDTQDVVVALQFRMHIQQPQVQHHVMRIARTTPLPDAMGRLAKVEPGNFGKHSIKVGHHDVHADVKRQLIAGQHMFVVGLTRKEHANRKRRPHCPVELLEKDSSNTHCSKRRVAARECGDIALKE